MKTPFKAHSGAPAPTLYCNQWTIRSITQPSSDLWLYLASMETLTLQTILQSRLKIYGNHRAFQSKSDHFLLANRADRLVAEPFIQAGFMEVVLAGQFPQHCSSLYVFQTDRAPAAVLLLGGVVSHNNGGNGLYLL